MIIAAYSPLDLIALDAGFAEFALFGTALLSGLSVFATPTSPRAKPSAVGLTARDRLRDVGHCRKMTTPHASSPLGGK
jgi:hypothetical protein